MAQQEPLKIHSCKTAMRTLAKSVKINFFRTMDMIQKFADNLRSIYSRKLLTLAKNTDLWGLLTCPVSTPSLLFSGSLENQQPHTHGKRP